MKNIFKAIETGKSMTMTTNYQVNFKCGTKGEGKNTLLETQDIVFEMAILNW